MDAGGCVMKKKSLIIFSILVVFLGIIFYITIHKEYTVTLANEDGIDKSEYIQPLLRNVKVKGDCDTDVVFTDIETGEKFIIGYITNGLTERIKLERGKWYKVTGGGNLIISPVNIRSAEVLEQNVSKKDIVLIEDAFWEDVNKFIFYDFGEDVYETSETEKLAKLHTIFSNLTYIEIENPWIEGWYLFEIHTSEKIYELRITGKMISFDGKFYKVTDSIAEEVTKIVINVLNQVANL